MSTSSNKLGNLKKLISLNTIKGRFIWMTIFFLLIFLGYSIVTLIQNRKVNKVVNQIIEVRLELRSEIEKLSTTVDDLLSNARNNILKRLPLNSDNESNYYEYEEVSNTIAKIEELNDYLPDNAIATIAELKTINETLNQNFKRADSIWEQNKNYYVLLNVRENLTDNATVTYLKTPALSAKFGSDTVKHITIEAEDAFYSGAFINYSHEGYQGSGYADYVNKKDDFLEANFVSEKAGTHLIYYTYAIRTGNRPLDIFIDDQIIKEKLDFAANDNGGWENWQHSDTLEVYLDSGIHSIKALATGKSGPNIDNINIIAPTKGTNTINEPMLAEAIPDEMIQGELNTKLFFLYRHEVNTMSAVDDILRASISIINQNLWKLRDINEQLISADNEKLKANLRQNNINNFIIFGIILVISILLIYITIRSLNRSLDHPLQLMKNLAAGDITKKAPNTKDELNQIIDAGNVLRDHLQKASEFANSIGEGNLESQYETGSDKDVLGKALLLMRNKLKAIAEEDRKNNWTSKGVSQFADLVRKNYDTMEDFAAIAISQLVKYIDAKLGMLYIKNDDDEEQIMLDLEGCYAYDRNKYLKQSIEPGFGYAGQVFLEKETVYLTDLPPEYVKIGSGLGETQPRSLLIVPVVANDVVEGVLEIASLQKYEPYQIKFVEKVAEIFATHIVNVKVNEKTNRLLIESKKQAEEMRAQEEELRQNMEELEAIHEQMKRDKEAEKKEVE